MLVASASIVPRVVSTLVVCFRSTPDYRPSSLSLLSSILYFFFFLICTLSLCFFFFFFNDTATTEIYTLSLHDALPISQTKIFRGRSMAMLGAASISGVPALGVPKISNFVGGIFIPIFAASPLWSTRSEEHTSELQSRSDLVCRLLLEKKKNHTNTTGRR